MLNPPSRKSRLLIASLVVTLLTVTAWSALRSTALAAEKVAEDTRLFELRTYTTNDGKFDALLSRFRDHTMDLFEKHGMTNVAYWAAENKDGQPNTLVYVMAYPDRAARDASWKGFLADPDWQKAYKESTADGKLVSNVESVFMNPTDFSPMK